MSEHQSTPPARTRPASGDADEQPRSDAFFDSIRQFGVVRADERWVGGVAAGLARRWDIDPLLIRGALVVLTIFGGLGLLLYGLAWALLPEERDGRIHAQEAVQGRVDAALAGALIMVVIGLARPTLWWSSTWWFGGWGSLLMVAALAGVLLAGYMIGRRNNHDESAVPPTPPTGAPTPTMPYTTPVAGQAAAPDTSLTPPAGPSTEPEQPDGPTPEPTPPAGSTPDASLPEPSTPPPGAAAGSALVRPMPADAALAPKVPSGPQIPEDADAATGPQTQADADGVTGTGAPTDPETAAADPDAKTDPETSTDPGTAPDPETPVDNDPPTGVDASTEAIDTAAPTEKLPGEDQTRAEQTFGGTLGDLPTPAVPKSTAAAPEHDTTASAVRPVTTKPSPRPRTPGPGSTTVRIVVGIALLAAAALLLVGRISGLDAALWLLAGGAVLAVLGLGLVITGLRGRRAGWLGAWSFLTAILVVPIALTLSVAPHVRDAVSLNPSMMGDSRWSPDSAEELAGGHLHTAGSMVVSLADLPADTTVEEPARIALAAGVLVVNVPAGMDVAIEVQGTGVLRVISPEPWYREGSQTRAPYDQALVATTTNLRPSAASGPADIELVVGVGAGDVLIREVRPVTPDDEPGSTETNETDADASNHDATSRPDAGERDTTGTVTEANDPDADTTEE